MVQGDAYQLEIVLDTDVPVEEMEVIEVTLGGLRKVWPEEVEYKDGVLLVPLSQKETMDFEGHVLAQVRIKCLDGTVAGSAVSRLDVRCALSKVVL